MIPTSTWARKPANNTDSPPTESNNEVRRVAEHMLDEQDWQE